MHYTVQVLLKFISLMYRIMQVLVELARQSSSKIINVLTSLADADPITLA